MMQKKHTATIDIAKAIAGIPFAVLASVGGASGNLLFAGLATIPVATLMAYDTISNSLKAGKLGSHKEDPLELPIPAWWQGNIQSWQSLCSEIEQRLPDVLQRMVFILKGQQGYITEQHVRQAFIDSLTYEPLHIWASIPEERKHIGESIATPLLTRLDLTLKPIIQEMRRNAAWDDISAMRSVISPYTLVDEEIARLQQQYCVALYNQWKTLDFRGIKHIELDQPMGIPLMEVFVFPHVIVGMPEHETLEREIPLERDKLSKSKEDRPKEDELKRQEHTNRKRPKKPIALKQEDLRTVLAKYRRLIILGDPGSGKSTFLRYLMLLLAEPGNRIATEFPALAAEALLASPVYIPLATYAETLLSNTVGERSLVDFLPKYLHDRYLSEYTEMILEQLQRGRLFLLLDGLDEIPDVSLRIQVVRDVETFTQSYQGNRFIVTSRIVGYRDAPLAAEYAAYTLADFDKEQIRTFTNKWCPSYERWVNQVTDNQALQHAATKEAEKLFQATQRNDGVKRLAVNPLLLTILALIQRQGIELPSHRVELYDLCTITLLDTWIKAKGVKGSIYFDKNKLFKILCPLAFWMHQYPAIGAIPENELTEEIVRQLLERHVTRYEDDAAQLAEEFLQIIHGKTGILIERGKQRYGFLHTTFEEYFAARELVKREDRDTFIKEHLHDSRWREVILLAIATIGILQFDEGAVTKLIQNAVLDAQSPFEQWLHRNLLFAGYCLADDVGVSITFEDTIIQEIVYLYFSTPYYSLRTTISTVLNVWRDTHLAEKVIDLVTPFLFRQNLLDIPSVFSLMATPPSSTDIVQFQDTFQELYERFTQQIQESSSNALRVQATKILHRLNIDVTEWTEYILTYLLDPAWPIRKAAATALGQIDGEQSSVIEALLKALLDPDSDVRKAAATALGQISSSQISVIEALLKAYSDPDPDVQEVAAIALGQIGSRQPSVVETLLTTLSDPDPHVREATATALGRVGSEQPSVVEALLTTMSDPDWSVRWAATIALGRVGSEQPSVIEALLKALSDPDPDVQDAAATALGRVGSEQPSVVETLLTTLSDPDPHVREATATALGRVGSEQPSVVEALLTTMSDPNLVIRSAVATALGRVGSGQPGVLEALLTMLSDPDSDVQEAAAIALGQVGSDQAGVVEALLETLANPHLDVREAATVALGRVGSGQPGVVEALLKMLFDHDPDVRLAAATALGRVGSGQPGVVEALIKAIPNSGSDVQEMLAIALGQISNGYPETVNTLLKMLTDPIWSVRVVATTALGQVGSGQLSIVEALLKMLTDPIWSIRSAAATALGQVGSGQPGVVEALLKSLFDPDTDVQEAAAIALDQVGSEHPTIAEYLSTILSNTSQVLFFQGQEQANYQRRISEDILVRLLTLLMEVGSGQSSLIETLIRALSHPAWIVRLSASIALGRVGSGQSVVVEVLIETLSDPDPDVREAATTAISQVGSGQLSVVKALLKMLSDPVWSVRRAAATALGRVGSGQLGVVEALLKSLADPAWPVGQDAATALGQVGTGQPSVVEALLKSLADPSPSVRWAAATALGQVGTDQPGVVEALLKAFAEPNPDVRERVAIALSQVGTGQPSVIEALLKRLADPSSSVRWAAATALGQVDTGQPGVVEALLETLVDPDPEVRERAAIALSQVGTDQPGVVEALLETLADRISDVRWAAVIALGQVGTSQPGVVDALLKSLTDPSWLVRRVAALALSQVSTGQPGVVDALLKSLTDPGSSVRWAAATALSQVGTGQPSVVEALLETLADPEPTVRQDAIAALGQISDGQPDVVAALLKALFDSDTSVRRAAASAIGYQQSDSITLGILIEDLLNRYKAITSKQFSADASVNSLFQALQQVIGEP